MTESLHFKPMNLICIFNYSFGVCRYMHECKLAHMDIKPSNIFLKIGWPKLTFKHNDHYSDFNDEDSRDEQTTYKIGNVAYGIYYYC